MERAGFAGLITRIAFGILSHCIQGDLEFLEAFPDLEAFSLHVCEFHDEDLQPLSNLTHFEN